MYILGIVMLFAVGYLTVFNISTATTRLERVGLAFPVGVGVCWQRHWCLPLPSGGKRCSRRSDAR